MEELVYRIALTMVPGIGDVLGKKLASICGGAGAVFREPDRYLKKFARVGELIRAAKGNRAIFDRAEREVVFIERFRITPLWFQDEGYPRRLKNCIDSPVLLFFKGTRDLNTERVIGIVGTRRASEYGREVTHSLIEGLNQPGLSIISGLAFGIDSCAHRASVDLGITTVGVLGHGLDTVYPKLNRSLAERMVNAGGLITEFISGTKPDKINFPRRNRIIAGMCDALLVVEAGEKGGALITADIANSYNRDVFAIPGRVTDLLSSGTNRLISTNRAALVQSAADVSFLLGWTDQPNHPAPVQRKIFIEMTEEEERVVGVLQEKGNVTIDEIFLHTGIPMSRVSASLLNLEFEGVVKCLPGKVYSLV
jgi:DNA processing protein